MKPEEEVRQAWIARMICDLGYPKQRIICEKELATFPHLHLLPRSKLPKRRIDIAVFSPELSPLLIIECKVAPLHPKFITQVLSYNTYIQAPFIAVANAEEIVVGYFDAEKGETLFCQGLPSYDILQACIIKSR